MSTAIGIMTHRIRRPESFRKDVQEAIAAGFDGLFAFTPQDVDLAKKKISAYEWTEQGWVRTIRSYPPIAIDIGYYTKASVLQKVKQIRHPRHIPFTGYGLGNKWTVHQLLSGWTPCAPYVLPTILLAKNQEALDFIELHQSVMVKPVKGALGLDHKRVTLQNGLYHVKEHRKLELKYSPGRFAELLNQWKASQSWLMQEWRPLDAPNGQPYDFRVLLQKDGEGKWVRTAAAVRERSLPAKNAPLAANEQVYEPLGYLERWFGASHARELVSRTEALSEIIPAYLEEAGRRRLADLGLDFAVDAEGRLWLLEASAKPERSIVRRLYGKRAAEESRRLAFRYAAHLLREPGE